jgi:hypothetical protein
MQEARFIRQSLLLLSGLLIWAGHFTFLYGFNTLACARRFTDVTVAGFGIVPFVVAVATIVALAAVLGIALFEALLGRKAQSSDGRHARATQCFLRYTTLSTALMGLMAILWTGLPALMVQPCA